MSDDTASQLQTGIENLNLGATTSEKPQPTRHVIAEDGDVLLGAIGGDTFLVSSQILSAASPKLRNILTEGKYDSTPFETDRLSAPLSVALNALHHGKTREILTLPELAEVALFVDMYDLQDALKRFITIWTEVWRRDDMDGLDLATLANWIAISYAFGLEEEFEIATREFIRFIRDDGTGDLYKDEILRVIRKPVMDEIMRLQRDRVERLVNYLTDEKQKRLSAGLGANCKSSNASVPRVLEDRKKCDSYQLGNLVYAMNSENMPTFDQSIHEAVGGLEAIAELGTHNPEYNHDACSWNRQMRNWLVDVEEEDLCLKLSSFPDRLPIIAIRNSVAEADGDAAADEEQE